MHARTLCATAAFELQVRHYAVAVEASGVHTSFIGLWIKEGKVVYAALDVRYGVCTGTV